MSEYSIRFATSLGYFRFTCRYRLEIANPVREPTNNATNIAGFVAERISRKKRNGEYLLKMVGIN